VGHWEAKGEAQKNGITPGRIGHVFFSTASALRVLEGKPPGWRNATLSGFWPSSSAPRPVRPRKKNS
jgi:hypothetical protein